MRSVTLPCDVLVQQEDRHAGGAQQLTDLRPAGSQVRSRVAIRGCLPDAVRFIKDQAVQVIGSLCMNELKYWKLFLTRREPFAATLRRVCVKDREPVAWMTVRP